jgi:hypothetical protein
MSQANTPENSQDRSEPAQSSSTWYSGWDDVMAEPQTTSPLTYESSAASGNSQPHAADLAQGDSWQDWQTVNFPNALSVDAIAHQSPQSASAQTTNWATEAAPTPSIDLPTWAQNDVKSIDSPEQPPIADLISLIQELNQCNSALIDRVSQLEEALERSENALQAELGRSPEPAQPDEPQALAIIHDQIDQLVEQLEFAHQTNQRQQILLETLTEQFENSQERVAQLERECVSLQQRYNEQAHLLTQSENSCRDLHARLQRQQRYTLQFKVALEKCLEVAPPRIETEDDLSGAAITPLQPLYDARSSLNPQSLLPKVQRIQPWSAAPSKPLVGKLKLESLVHSPEPISSPEPEPNEEERLAMVEPDAIAPFSTERPKPPSIQLPFQASNGAESADGASQASAEEHDFEHSPIAQQALELGLEILKQPNLSPDAIQAGLAELQAALGEFSTPSSDGAAAAAADGDAEAALWQDLARLIDVSTDDVIKANQAKDFDTFEIEATEPEADANRDESLVGLDAIAETPVIPTPLPEPAIAHSAIQSIQEPRLPLATVPQKMAAFSKEVMEKLPEALTVGGSPSPIVYPLRRPAKKLESLAAVDLPSFPR